MNLTIKDLAHDIALAGVPVETARNRISSYAQNGLIHGRRDGPNTSPNRYKPADAAIAIMLSALQDCGVADLDLQGDVVVATYLGMERCLAGLAKGESWCLVVDVYRGALGRFLNVNLVRHGQPASQPIPLTPRGAIVIVLDEMLSPVVRRLHPPKGAH
ncbi:hypothetical protein [Mesorhizobium huakuii]|uniref:MerR family transcriptional regulator n=1 Tax=Mesorhizobium huakuii TaxID=28104 RepID=A0ABZ0VRN0_9HYPH|nr:hypothetical protein [Mesorhizobium huakuii]WQB99538.1 hypothetical protein U0R22_003719 [Mesorhizobium huakuii]